VPKRKKKKKSVSKELRKCEFQSAKGSQPWPQGEEENKNPHFPPNFFPSPFSLIPNFQAFFFLGQRGKNLKLPSPLAFKRTQSQLFSFFPE